MAKRFIVKDLGKLCKNYRKQLIYITDEDYKNALIDKIKNSYGDYPSIIPTFKKLFFASDKWIDTLMKMDPHRYHNDRRYFELSKMHEDQVNFARKIIPIVQKYDFDDSTTIKNLTDRYGMFLSLCLQNKNTLIVPTLIEDFVWHSHMTNNEDYVQMTKSMFGGILGHQTNIDLQKAKDDTKEIRKKFYENNGHANNSTIGLVGMGVAATTGAVMSTHHNQQIKDERKDERKDTGTTLDNGTILSDCGPDIMGFGPSGIFNPVNPWTSVNPLSPYYDRSYNHSYYSSPGSGISLRSSLDSMDSTDSSCSSSSCSSSSCGGGGD